ncbi:MAG: lipid-A-disaccharide synthase, partial [Desulfobacteraceae bacterium IS3]
AMLKKNPALSFSGIGGEKLKDAGVCLIADASTLSVVGITEVFSKLPGIFKGMAAVKKFLRTRRPDLLILIDFPDFNLHIAGTAKRLNIPVLYYISPQIWAWRRGRVKKIRKRVSHIAVILPFEESFYRKHNIPASYVGHPLLDQSGCTSHSPAETLRIAFLPGSREGEIARHLPLMLEAACILNKKRKDMEFVISLAPSVKREFAENIISHFSLLTPHSSLLTPHFSYVTGAEKAFETCSAAVAASGTVTLQGALAGVPMAVIYKVSPLSYLAGRALIKVRHISLVNLIAGREIVPELIQGKASPENIADTVLNMTDDPRRLERMKSDLLGIRNMLGRTGASERVADIATDMLILKKVRNEK